MAVISFRGRLDFSKYLNTNRKAVRLIASQQKTFFLQKIDLNSAHIVIDRRNPSNTIQLHILLGML